MATGQIGTLLVPLLGWKILFLIGGIPGLILAGLVAAGCRSHHVQRTFAWPAEGGRGGDRLGGSQRRSQRPKLQTQGFVGQGLVGTGGSSEASELPRPAAETPAVTGRGNRWRELLSPVYRRRTLIVWTLWGAVISVANSLNNSMCCPLS